jgi:hypothetical protein
MTIPGSRLRILCGLLVLLLPAGAVVGAIVSPAVAAAASPGAIGLGSAGAASVLSGAAVTSTGATVLSGDLDLFPGTAATGFPPGTVNGSEHLGDVVAGQAHSDLLAAYSAAAAAPATHDETGLDLSGQTLVPGVYNASGGMTLTGTTPLVLDGDASSVWILQAGSTLDTAAGTSVRLIGGAQACNVFWQVGSSATMGANSTFAGNIMASASITMGAGLSLDGRALADTGSVTLADNQITGPECATTVSSLTLSSSEAGATFAAPVTLTADMSSTDATGSVRFDDLLSSGPQAGQIVTVGTATLGDGTASVTVTLPAFGSNTITAYYGGDTTYAPSTSLAVDVPVAAYPGEVIVNQMRLSGPGGPGDQFVELYNTGPSVPLAGFVVSDDAGNSVTVPTTGPTLPRGHSYLVGGDAYLLGDVASADLTSTNLAATGVQVAAPDAAATVVDAVGFTGAPNGFFSGTPLPALAGTPTEQYAWVRREVAGAPVNTSDNATDFNLVSTTGGLVGGTRSMLGSPAPLASGSPVQDNGQLRSALLDPTVLSSVGANFVYVRGAPGTLTVRRTITNSGDAPVTSAEVRITALSETDGAPEPGVATQPVTPAALRLVDPATSTSQVLVGANDVTVHNLSLDSPADPSAGAGTDSTLSVPLSGGLAPGLSINVAFTFAVDHGGRYWFGYDVDALTGPISTAGPSSLKRLLVPSAPAARAGGSSGGELKSTRNRVRPGRRQGWPGRLAPSSRSG